MTDNLQRAVQDYDSSLQKSGELLYGEIGTYIKGKKRTIVPNRGQFVYVRLRSNQSEVIQAFNDKVFPGFGIPVLLKWSNNRYEVIGRDVQRYPEWEENNPQIAKHGQTHSLDKDGNNLGSDPVWVYPYQFVPHLVSPFNINGVQNAYIHPHTINYKGDWRYVGNTGTPSLVSYNPTSGSAVVLITIDAQTGNPALFSSSGTFIPSTITGSMGLIPYIPDVDRSRYLPVSFARLVSGTSQITWNNLYDVRQFLSHTPSLHVNSFSDIDNLQFSGATVLNSGTVSYISFAGGGGSTGSFGNLRFDIEGIIETGTSMSQPYLITDPSSISMAYLYAEGLGVTGTTIIDVLKNNVSIFTGTPLSLPYNLTGSWVSLAPFYTSFVRGDILKINVLQKAQEAKNIVVELSTGIGLGASGLTVQETDGNPSIASVETLIFSNARVTDQGSRVVSIGLLPDIKTDEYTPTGTFTTVSGSYTDVASSNIEVSITKTEAAAVSDLVFNFSGTLFSTATNTVVVFGVNDGSTDYEITSFFINVANDHKTVSRPGLRITGLAAGSYTFRLRWKRSAGAGTLTVNSDDRLYLSVEEAKKQ